MSLDVVTTPLRAVTPHFQRSINLTYDVGDADYVANYIPTPNGAKALAIILSNALFNVGQRAHVLHAAYGSGKSLLGLVLGTFASHDAGCHGAISVVQERLQRTFPKQAEHVDIYLNSGKRLLPVILSGDEGYFSTALTKALSRALAQHDIAELNLPTQFQAALNVIELWKHTYPEAYQQLASSLSERGTSLDWLTTGLRALERTAFALFTQLYPTITAGAEFDPNTGMSPEDIFRAIAQSLHTFKYDGILVIWDEFGRFLDSRVGDAFGKEAALVQSFAEFCNRSGTHQVHLVLITHRLLSGYATGLPLSYQQEWARIAERFLSHDVSSDPTVVYRLIAEALSIPNPNTWQAFTEKYRAAFDELTAFSLELSLFDELDDIFLRQQIVERAWPLHPLSVYALPRLASRVAQNERTLFTFLAASEPETLAEQLAKHKDTDAWWLIHLDAIWDYFSEAIRTDTAAGGTHAIWSGAMYTLSKVDKDDTQAQSLIKALATLLIVSEINVRSKEDIGRVVPTTELLAWSLGNSLEEVSRRLEMLVQRRAVIHRRSDGYWTFTRGSDIDLDAELSKAIDRQVNNQQQIRQTLEQDFPLPFHLPRGYNQEKYITRFFRGFYCWPNEMKNTSTEAFLKQRESYGYADGAIVYVLATNAAEREQAIDAVQKLSSGRVIYVIPDHPLLLMEPVRELFALRDLSSDAAFMQRDDRLVTEIAFLVEDTERRLKRAVRPFLEPDYLKATWWWHDNAQWHSAHLKTRDISQLLSLLCTKWFSDTPVLNNELVNRHEPTIQQERAIEKVIDSLLNHPSNLLPPNLDLPGHGPDWLIIQTLLIDTKLMQLMSTGQGFLQRPENNPEIVRIWDIVQGFLNEATENEQELFTLIDKLQSPPYGLRRGVLPILLAVMFRFRLPVLTICRGGKMISPITGQVFISLCKEPDQYTVELSPWDTRRSILWAVLEERVGNFLTAQERTQQPFNVLSVGLIRWLQSLPRYCRETSQVSHDAQRLRVLIRKAQRDPAQVLAHELLDLLDDSSISADNQEAYRQMLTDRLSFLMDEIATAYQTLLYSLDRFAGEAFAVDAADGYTAVRLWLASIEERVGKSLDTFRLSDKLAQRLVEVASQHELPQKSYFWDQLSKAVLGIALNDWNDRSDENFKRNLLEAKERVEHEIFELTKDESAVELSVALPTKDEQTYRFRQSNLSPQGQRILQNFKSTLEIAGRPLSPDEKRQIVLALLKYVMGGADSND